VRRRSGGGADVHEWDCPCDKMLDIAARRGPWVGNPAKGTKLDCELDQAATGVGAIAFGEPFVVVGLGPDADAEGNVLLWAS
jgi:hypothetical protein